MTSREKVLKVYPDAEEQMASKYSHASKRHYIVVPSIIPSKSVSQVVGEGYSFSEAWDDATPKLPPGSPAGETASENRDQPWRDDYVIPHGDDRCSALYGTSQCFRWAGHGTKYHWACGGSLEWLDGEGPLAVPAPVPTEPCAFCEMAERHMQRVHGCPAPEAAAAGENPPTSLKCSRCQGGGEDAPGIPCALCKGKGVRQVAIPAAPIAPAAEELIRELVNALESVQGNPYLFAHVQQQIDAALELADSITATPAASPVAGVIADAIQAVIAYLTDGNNPSRSPANDALHREILIGILPIHLAQPSAEGDGWIAVEKKMPVPYRDVWVWGPDLSQAYQDFLARPDSLHDKWNSSGLPITHWHPIVRPTPPVLPAPVAKEGRES